MKRESLGSRLGFILISAGCAIGIGNVWRFPYVVGQNGGGIFVLIYLLFLAIMGIPVMTMEFAMGRAARTSPARLYHELAPSGSPWRLHSYFAIAGNVILMMFYTSVTAWMIRYFVYTARGDFVGLDASAVSDRFGEMLCEPWSMVAFVVGVIVVGFLVCSFGVQKGLERISKPMMLALLVIMVVLGINSLTLEGAGEGLSFYLLPSLSTIKDVGIIQVVRDAMNQAFFTLSVGIGSMAIFGSYIGKERSLLGESVSIAALDTLVAIFSGIIIFPACFTYGTEVGAGPALIFQTLPNVFNRMPLGRLWGSLFFVFMTFAAMSTVFAVFENIISCTSDLFGWSKKKSCLIDCIAMILLALPCIFGFNLLSGFAPFGEGSSVLDLEDFIVSNVLLPLGSLVFVLFCTSRYGWGWKKFVAEANEGKGLKVARWMRPYMTYVLPLFVLTLFVLGILGFFGVI